MITISATTRKKGWLKFRKMKTLNKESKSQQTDFRCTCPSAKYKQYQNPRQVSSTDHYIKMMTLMKLIGRTIQQII